MKKKKEKILNSNGLIYESPKENIKLSILSIVLIIISGSAIYGIDSLVTNCIAHM